MIASRWRVYIKPFTELGVRAATWTEVTNDVVLESIGSLSNELDNTDYNIGLYRSSAIQLKLTNDSGKYSDIDTPNSIFRYKRSDSLVKITWDQSDDESEIGAGNLGEIVFSEETEVFTGLLSDESATMDADAQVITFTVLGREATFDRVVVPIASLAIGNLISVALYTMLNQTVITDVLTVDLANIVPGLDTTLDFIADLANLSVREGLREMLKISNSVVYIENGAIKVKGRTPTAAVMFHFYGQASVNGPENIASIRNIKSGLSRTFNFALWEDADGILTTVTSQDNDSIAKYGLRKLPAFASPYITVDADRTAIIDSVVDEFGTPKKEFDLTAPLSFDIFSLNLLDRIDIDYPTRFLATSDELPICGIAVCGEAVLPRGLWAFTIDTTSNFKILGRKLDIKSETITFRLREI
jgi:hypothetical protein